MRKKPTLLKNIYCFNEPNKKLIGLIGTHQGAGVTHTGMLLASFLGNMLGKKTAFLEINGHQDFQKLEDAYYGKEEYACQKSFLIDHVTYYKSVTEADVTEILNQKYDYYIFDFGCDLGKNQQEFLRCDRKIVVGSLVEWKKDLVVHFIDTNQYYGNEEWLYLMVFGNENDVQSLKKERKVKVKTIGYEPALHILSKDTIQLFRGVI
jgi:hypothetical protein